MTDLDKMRRIRALLIWSAQDARYLSEVVVRSGDEHRQTASDLLEVVHDQIDRAESLLADLADGAAAVEVEQLTEAELRQRLVEVQ